MACISNALQLRHGISLWCPEFTPMNQLYWNNRVASANYGKRFSVSASAFSNENREFVIVGGGNAAGYVARTFVEHGFADRKLCIVSKEKYAPYERPALTKAYLFPSDKKPARLPVVKGRTRNGYKEKGIEIMYEDPVVDVDIQKQTLRTNSGKLLKYGSLIIATGCTGSRFPDKLGESLPGVHYIRDVEDANSLVSSLMIFPENHLMNRLFTSSLAHKHQQLYYARGVKLIKGASIKSLEAGSDGRVACVKLENGMTISTDLVVAGIGARKAVSPFESVGLNNTHSRRYTDGLFRTSIPGIFAIGDVPAFPLKVEHVDHAHRSAEHCVKSLLTARTDTYDYLPYFYSRVFEYEGSKRKVAWQFFGE